MNRILLAVNDSKPSERAARVSRSLLDMNPQTKLCVVYVTLLLPARFGNSPLLGMDYEKELALKLFAKLHEEYFKGLNQRVQFEHKWGTGPAKVIFRAAIDCSCELIVDHSAQHTH